MEIYTSFFFFKQKHSQIIIILPLRSPPPPAPTWGSRSPGCVPFRPCPSGDYRAVQRLSLKPVSGSRESDHGFTPVVLVTRRSREPSTPYRHPIVTLHHSESKMV